MLQPMRAETYPAFLEAAVATYAAENTAAGRWPEAEAEGLSRAETGRLLPQGVATPGHHLFEIVASDPAAPVGYLWMGALPRGSVSVAFVYQVLVLPEHRRQGHARAALSAAEAFADDAGLAGLALHVFAHNAGAQALYRSLGYQVASLNLFKPLARGSRSGAHSDPLAGPHA